MVYGLYECASAFSVSNTRLNSVYMLRDTDSVGMNVSFRIKNPSSTDLVLRSVKYYITVDGVRVGEVSGGDELVLRPSSSKEITVVVRVKGNE